MQCFCQINSNIFSQKNSHSLTGHQSIIINKIQYFFQGCDQETGFKTRNILCFPIRCSLMDWYQQQWRKDNRTTIDNDTTKQNTTTQHNTTQHNKTMTISSLNEAKHWQVFGVSQRKVLKNKDCKASAFFQYYIWKTSNQSSSATRTVWSGWRSCATSKPTHILQPLTKRWRWLFPPTVVLPFFTGDF